MPYMYHSSSGYAKMDAAANQFCATDIAVCKQQSSQCVGGVLCVWLILRPVSCLNKGLEQGPRGAIIH